MILDLINMVEISGTIITLDIFRCSVAVLVAPDKESVIKGVPKLYKKWKVPKEDTEKEIKSIKEAIDSDEDIWKGITVPSGVDAVVIFLEKDISEVSEECAVHEFNHAMRYICRVHGMEDEETESYMLEYLCNQFWTAQDDWNATHSKKKKRK